MEKFMCRETVALEIKRLVRCILYALRKPKDNCYVNNTIVYCFQKDLIKCNIKT